MDFNNGVLEQNNLRFILQPEDKLQFAKSFTGNGVDAVFWVNSNARFLYVNDAACCLTGYSRKELLFMTMYDVNPDFSEDVWLKYWRTIKQQSSLTFESLHQTKEGKNFFVEVNVIYLEYRGSEYGCILVRDISEHENIELNLQKTNLALECRIQELLTELRDTNAQLCHEIAERQRVKAQLEESLSLLHANLESNSNGTVTVSSREEIVTFNRCIGSQPTETKKSPGFQSIFPACSQLSKVFQFIEDNYHQPINLCDVALAVGYSPGYLTSLVKRQTRRTVHCWIVERRMVEARYLLLETDELVNQIATKVGYQDTGYFIRQFRQLHNMSPKAWRNTHCTNIFPIN